VLRVICRSKVQLSANRSLSQALFRPSHIKA
jgi:hypothetical protein